VRFADLGLVVVDEQHRFGVHQRLALQKKAKHAADVLVMSATPIPRTLALALYGDMDISRLDEKPPGRRPVRTATIPLERLNEVIAHLREAVERGERAYWICPVVEDSDALPATSAEERFATLLRALPGKVGLAHGRMKGEARDAVMEDFRAGRISVLVATTVVEVGVDVPEASIIIIENAERFGLAQLHQLRGRVGRGERPSSCVLLYREPLTATARERLRVMRETEDGFVIAEADLKLRGAGDLLGAKQSGLPQFRTADLARQGDLLAMARDDARRIILQDPDLASARGRALRHLLYLYERDAAVPLLAAG
jgi:ATP-dependent DNA helicase RecG